VALRLRLVAAAAVTLGVVTATAPSYAATGSPPVTVPDHATVRAGEGGPIDVAANDTDPDGDEVRACRLGPTPRALGATSIQEGQVVVSPGRRVHGTYTLTYYACDTSYLTPGTVTVRVRPPRPTLDVFPVSGLPGRVRIVNTYKTRTFRCEWGPLDGERDEGRATVPPRSTVVVRVHESDVQFECRSGNVVIGIGIVSVSGRAAQVEHYSAKASGGGHAQTRLRSP